MIRGEFHILVFFNWRLTVFFNVEYWFRDIFCCVKLYFTVIANQIYISKSDIYFARVFCLKWSFHTKRSVLIINVKYLYYRKNSMITIKGLNILLIKQTMHCWLKKETQVTTKDHNRCETIIWFNEPLIVHCFIPKTESLRLVILLWIWWKLTYIFVARNLK